MQNNDNAIRKYLHEQMQKAGNFTFSYYFKLKSKLKWNS